MTREWRGEGGSQHSRNMMKSIMNSPKWLTCGQRPNLDLTLRKEQVYYRKPSIQRWGSQERGESSFRFLTLLTLLLCRGMLAALLWWLAWEHIKTLLPPFDRRFRYKKRFYSVLISFLEREKICCSWIFIEALPCFVETAVHCISSNEWQFKEVCKIPAP